MSKRVSHKHRQKQNATNKYPPTRLLFLPGSLACLAAAIAVRNSGRTLVWGSLMIGCAYLFRLGLDYFIVRRFPQLEITPSVDWGIMALCGLFVFLVWFIVVPIISGQSIFQGF